MKISVGLCTFNGETYIKQQLDSIICQSKAVDEIVICDDGSSDSTWEILQAYQQKHPSLIKIKKNTVNLKSVKNFEQVLSTCSGDIIFLSDQDDLWTSNKVQEYIAFLNENPRVNVVCSNGHIIDENNVIMVGLTVWDAPHFLKKQNENIDYFASMCYGGNIATGASMAIRRDYVSHVLPIPNLDNFHHDEWIALISSFEKHFDFIDKKLFSYRIHRDQQVGLILNPNSIVEQTTLYNNFSSSQDNSFSAIKKKLKKLSSKHARLLQATGHPVLNDILLKIKKNHQELTQNLITHYPIKGRLTHLLDKLTRKRQIR